MTNNSVFDRGFAPIFDRDALFGDQWHVPALSSPVGGNPVGRIENNIDMNTIDGVPRPNDWGRGSSDWQHSDMKDMAYFYVYKLYEQLMQKGNLK